MTAAWTPELPDDRVTENPSAAIAAAQEFNPEDLDHFDPVAVCGAEYVFARIPQANLPDLTITMVCQEEPGHFPDTPHSVTITWTDDGGLPAEPACATCADVGVLEGEPCPAECPAAQPFIDAAKVRAANRP